MFRKACLPDIRYKDTKNGKSLDRIYKKVSIKYRNKKTSKPNPSPRVRKAQRLFFFTCINFVT
jgi:G:T-mismatch repair DNA endonuclease (very short patch repair protein)